MKFWLILDIHSSRKAFLCDHHIKEHNIEAKEQLEGNNDL